MFIKQINISNFRGIDVKIDNLVDSFLIYGRNDSGKSNLCYAIRKVLDIEIRRIPFLVSDSSNYNKKSIEIEIVLDITDIGAKEISILGKYLDEENNKRYLYTCLIGTYNKETLTYDEELYFGKRDIKKFASNNSNPLDRVLQLIYIEPSYNYKISKNKFFQFNKRNNDENQRTIDEKIINQVEALNNNISQDSIVTDMQNDINNYINYSQIFEDTKFKIVSNFDLGNIYNSLDIQATNDNIDSIGNMGDGKEKTLSMLLKQASYDSNKKRIIIVEEPENHMYPLYQKTFLQLISELGMSQTIYTVEPQFIINKAEPQTAN